MNDRDRIVTLGLSSAHIIADDSDQQSCLSPSNTHLTIMANSLSEFQVFHLP